MSRKPKSFVFFCKTYIKDIDRFRNLYKTYLSYNEDGIELYVSVPEDDLIAFSEFNDKSVTLISDESYAKDYFTKEEYWGLSEGYLNQEICKLSFWETGIAENYLCIDSDAYFIRKFYISDFMANSKTPYSVLMMDKDLNIEHGYIEFGKWRKSQITKIFDAVGLKDKRMLTCHGVSVINNKVLNDFKTNFMNLKNYTYKDLMMISPYEFSWYSAWLQKSKIIEIVAVEPFFKVFHQHYQYAESRTGRIREIDYAEQYVGIIMNSNWRPKKAPLRYKDPGKFNKLVYKILDRVG